MVDETILLLIAGGIWRGSCKNKWDKMLNVDAGHRTVI